MPKIERKGNERLAVNPEHAGIKAIVLDNEGEVSAITCLDCGRQWAYMHDEIMRLDDANATGLLTRCFECEPLEACGRADCERCNTEKSADVIDLFNGDVPEAS